MAVKKYDVVALGELNVDLILNQIDGFPEIGKEKFAGSMTMTLGSSTAIFAANASALGLKVAFAGMVGRDQFGELVKSSLAAKGVSTEFLIESDAVATGATIVMSYDEDRANLTYQGAMDVMAYSDLDKELFKCTKHIHISSVFMQSALMKDLDLILSECEANGVTVSMDTQWDPVEKWDLDYRNLLKKVNVFMPNATELKFLTGRDTMEAAIEEIRPYLKEAAVIKCGSKGSVLVTKDGEPRQLPPFLNTNVVDTIGAGDSFNAGFVLGWCRGCDLQECQRLGTITGAVSTTAAGGTGAFSDKEKIVSTAKDLFGVEIIL